MAADQGIQRVPGTLRAATRRAAAPMAILLLSVLAWVHPRLDAPVAAARPGDAAADELKRHQGTWTVTASIFDGQPAGAEVIRSIVRIVTGDHVVWKRDGKSFAGTRIELDSAREPGAIDVIPDGGRNRGERVFGIYKLEG